MKAHQKCFSLRDKTSGKLANRFILVSNLEAEDGGAAIVAGNERVIRARGCPTQSSFGKTISAGRWKT